MKKTSLELIPLERALVEPLANYWSNLSEHDLLAMGVEVKKLPTKDQFISDILQQLDTPTKNKKAFALIAMLNGNPIGHCNLNPVAFGDTAKMHLHIWNKADRKMGWGLSMIQKAIPIFFNSFQLKEIICEPMASNPGPNKSLQKAGFVFMRKYFTTPGPINFEQEVCRWRIIADALSNK